MRRLLPLAALAAALGAACGQQGDGQSSEFAPRNLTVLVGGAQGTSSLNQFFPQRVEIRAGDTVTWRMNGTGDDPHTVTFAPDINAVVDIVPKPNGLPHEFIFEPTLVESTRGKGDAVEEYEPGGYFNSGIMFGYQVGEGAEIIDTYALQFPEPGTYQYICGIHEFHRGTVVVKGASYPDAPDQAAISAEAIRQMEFGLGIVNSLQGLAAQETTILEREPGPDGATRYIVAAGMGTPEAEALEFFPRNLRIKKGDTVTWVSTRFHAVVFGGEDGPPPFYVTERRARGAPLIAANPDVLFPSEPSPFYDGEGFRSSGLMGYGQRPGGLGFSLTFTQAGVFAYTCPIHRGMVGRVSVSDG